MVTTTSSTIEELEREGPPEGRWELIDGALVEMAPSGGRASEIGTRAGRLLGNHAEPRGLGVMFGADGGFVLFPGRDLSRVADAALVRAERLPAPENRVGYLRLAPDLVGEVVSPYDRPHEVAEKTAMWLDAGVRLVWVADPDVRTVTVHALGGPPQTFHVGDELDGGEVLPDFRLAVADLFV